jgi:hypothetical protein
MKVAVWLLLGAVCGFGAAKLTKQIGHADRIHGGKKAESIEGELVHTEESFTFMAQAPPSEVAPLFGANEERKWAPGWEPEMLYPKPASDKQGMVFTVKHGGRSAFWINTELNLRDGRVQYVYVIPETMATTITLRLSAVGNETRVEVKYERTALSVEGNASVKHMAEQDRRAETEWETQVNGYLRSKKGS